MISVKYAICCWKLEGWCDSQHNILYSSISKNSRLVCFAAACLGMFALAKASILVLCACVVCCCGDQHTLTVDVQHELNNTCIYNVSFSSIQSVTTTHAVVFKTHSTFKTRHLTQCKVSFMVCMLLLENTQYIAHINTVLHIPYIVKS